MSEKLVLFLRRLPGVNADDFRGRYLEEHAPAVLRDQPDRRRYVANVVEQSEAGSRQRLLEFDAVDELWLEAVDDIEPTLFARESDLVDSVIAYHVAEHVQREYRRSWPEGERSPGRKMLSPLRRAEGLTHEQFADRWLNTHAPLALEHLLGLGGYVTNVVLAPLTPGSPEVDGIVEVYYVEERRFSSQEGEAALMEDTKRLLTPPARHWVSEYVMRG